MAAGVQEPFNCPNSHFGIIPRRNTYTHIHTHARACVGEIFVFTFAVLDRKTKKMNKKTKKKQYKYAHTLRCLEYDCILPHAYTYDMYTYTRSLLKRIVPP